MGLFAALGLAASFELVFRVGEVEGVGAAAFAEGAGRDVFEEFLDCFGVCFGVFLAVFSLVWVWDKR